MSGALKRGPFFTLCLVHTRSHTASNGYFKLAEAFTDSIGLLFTQYKTTWLTAISSHCVAALPSKISAFNISMRQNACYRDLNLQRFAAMVLLHNRDEQRKNWIPISAGPRKGAHTIELEDH